MTKSILCAVIGGMLVGATAFFAPHFLIGIFVFMLVVRLLRGCCGRHHGCCGGGRQGKFEILDKIRKMTDEEFSEFKNTHQGGCCSSKHNYHGNCCKSDNCGETTEKSK
jgi:hypothetical protein